MTNVVPLMAESQYFLADFDSFYTLYPRHEKRKSAAKAWERLDDAQRLAAICAIVDWRAVWRAQGREVQYIPLPATWLNGEQWTDEVPVGVVPPAREPTPPSVPTERTPMPDHVRTLLATLK